VITACSTWRTTQLHTLFPSTLGAAAESSLARFGELIDEEQYADFLRLRPFRQSLLCRAADGPHP
jgi:methyltransferase-like protein